MHDFLIYLLAMVMVVPLTKYIGLGSVIGYLIAGAIIGPHGLALLITRTEGTSQLAELGIIMMLLLIGLELNPRLLWKMRGPIFGLGTLQVLGTIGVFSSIMFSLGTLWPNAVAIGMLLSVSSTAIALQTLQEQGYAKSTAGERTVAVLLFQDLAVIPMLAILPFLGAGRNNDIESSPPWQKALLIFGAVALVVGAGRFIVHPIFKLVARTKLREIFTALALLIVIATAVLMHSVGLSPAFGAFLAGVVLADSEFRHQIEADIEPFKGLLLGLFFITIGSSIQFGLIGAKPLLIAQWTLAIVVGKALLIYGIGRLSRMRSPESLLFSVSLAQGGEFAFVLIAQSGTLLSQENAQILTASIALSMAIAPLLIKLTIQRGMSKLACVKSEERLPDSVDESEKDNPVLVVGIGRFGQTLVRFLRANGYPSTVLDIDSEQIDLMARFGIKSYFGDGSNPDLLQAAGLDRAKVLVLAIDEPETTLKITEIIRQRYPKLPIFARVFDRIHAYRMLHLGATEVAIETSGSALTLGTEVLKALGMRPDRAESKSRLFEVNNQRSIRDLSKRFQEDDTETFLQASRQMSEQLEALFRSDPEELSQGASSEWPPTNRGNSEFTEKRQ
jgi:monovalent cation:proton antiporter-2 (CPA2) family protein